MRWIDDLLGPRLSALVSESNFARHHGLHEFSARRLQSGPCLFVKHRRNSYRFTYIQASEGIVPGNVEKEGAALLALSL